VYATPDLKQLLEEFRSDAVYLPTPVKTDVFTPKTNYSDKPKAVYFKVHYEKLSKKLRELLLEHNISLTVKERNVPYASMPSVLSNFDIYVDQSTIPSLSKTCLEAMSCGLATIDYRHIQLSERVAFLSDVLNIKKIGDENRKFVIENHEVKKVAGKLTDVWNEVLSENE